MVSSCQQAGKSLSFGVLQFRISANRKVKAAFLAPHSMMLQPICKFHMPVAICIRTVEIKPFGGAARWCPIFIEHVLRVKRVLQFVMRRLERRQSRLLPNQRAIQPCKKPTTEGPAECSLKVRQ